jgi:hypothetical protein
MDDIVLARTLRAQGYNSDEVRRLKERGELSWLRRGVYVRDGTTDLSVEQQHRRLIEGTLPLLQDGAVVSHASAAVMHGLPVWPSAVSQVHVTRNRPGGGKIRTHVRVHGARLPIQDVTTIDGVAVTSLSRTVLDLCRTLPIEQAVAAGDRAFAYGLVVEVLEEALGQLGRSPGVRSARRAVQLMDARSESAGESVSRVRIVSDGLPPPEPQEVIRTSAGVFVARVDFLWKEQRTVGEFDGKVKYGRLLKPGQRIEEVVYEEKRREDAIRDLGWKVVRWLWEDLHRPGVLRDRLQRAFARG